MLVGIWVSNPINIGEGVFEDTVSVSKEFE
jgi:hypothetical protein